MNHLAHTRRIARRFGLWLAALMLWAAGPAQALAAFSTDYHIEALRTAGKARHLTLHEQKAIRGSQTMGGVSTAQPDDAGAPKPWGYSVPNLNGYGSAYNGNQSINVPILGWSGKGPGVSMGVSFNSAATVTGAVAPLSSGWTHSYNVYLEGVGGPSVTVVEGDGSRRTYDQDFTGAYIPPAGTYDSLVDNGNGTFTLTRKGGVALHFNASNKISSIVDLNGNSQTVAYGGNGLASTVTDASSRSLSLGYDGSNRLISIQDPLSRSFALSYDSNGHLERVTFPAPATGQAQPYFEFVSSSSLGLVTSFRDTRASTWTLAYDATTVRQVNSVTDPASNSRSFDWANAVITWEDSSQISWTADAAGNRTSVTLAADSYHSAETQYWSWDSQHNMLSRTTARGKVWDYSYDSSGNTLTIDDPDSVRVATITYNSLHRPTTSADGLNQITTYAYDSAQNLVSVTDALNNVTSYQYSTAGLLTQQTDANSHVTTYGYSSSGDMTSLTDPEHRVTSWTYTSLGWRASRTDALSRTTSYTYDNLGRQVATDYPTGTDASFVCDSGGLITSLTDASGTTTRAYDSFARTTSETKSGRTVSYTYSVRGARASMTDSDSRAFTYLRDNAGRLMEVKLGGATHATSSYDADGNLTSQLNPNATTVSNGYDNAGRLTSILHQNSGSGTIASYSYSYNSAGLRTGVTEASGDTVAWGYDALNRLTSEIRSGTYAFTASYSLDPVGNWTSRTVNGTMTTYAYSTADRISSATTGGSSTTYSWNNTGTLASRSSGGSTVNFTWDYDEQLTGMSTGQGFGYDSGGRRVSRTAGGTTTDFVFDGAAVLLEKQGSTTAASYTYGAGGLLTRSGETHHFDGHGSLRTTTSGTQTVTATGSYEAYGQGVGGTGSSATPYAYGGAHGYRSDGDNGLLHIGARWYDPVIGRWISADTYLGEIANPLSRNRYAYCEADPVNAVDPSGHNPVLIVIGSPPVRLAIAALLAIVALAVILRDKMSKPRRGQQEIEESYENSQVMQGQGTPVQSSISRGNADVPVN